MDPVSISASSLANWEDCPAKYRAVNIDKIPEVGKKDAAGKGSVVHYALEHFVDEVFLKKTRPWNDKARLDELLKEGFREVFRSAEYASANFKDAQKMADEWYERTDLTEHEVISVEERHQLVLPATSGDIKLTYIIDRLDLERFDDGWVEFHVVDYKSQQMAESFEDIRNKLQAQIYAMAVFMTYGHTHPIRSVWVHLDLLRHDARGVEFTYDDIVQTFGWLCEQVDIIRATPYDNPPERLGPGCAYCPRKSGCESLRKHQSVDGVMALDDPVAAAALRQQIHGQIAGLRNLEVELDGIIEALMQRDQVSKINLGEYVAEWGNGRRERSIEPAVAQRILGPEIMTRVTKVGITEVDNLIKSQMLTDEQVTQLQNAIKISYGNPGVKFKKAPKPRKPKGT